VKGKNWEGLWIDGEHPTYQIGFCLYAEDLANHKKGGDLGNDNGKNSPRVINGYVSESAVIFFLTILESHINVR